MQDEGMAPGMSQRGARLQSAGLRLAHAVDSQDGGARFPNKHDLPLVYKAEAPHVSQVAQSTAKTGQHNFTVIRSLAAL